MEDLLLEPGLASELARSRLLIAWAEALVARALRCRDEADANRLGANAPASWPSAGA